MYIICILRILTIISMLWKNYLVICKSFGLSSHHHNQSLSLIHRVSRSFKPFYKKIKTKKESRKVDNFIYISLLNYNLTLTYDNEFFLTMSKLHLFIKVNGLNIFAGVSDCVKKKFCFCCSMPHPGQNLWFTYRSQKDVDGLLKSLHPQGIRESLLKKEIKARYDDLLRAIIQVCFGHKLTKIYLGNS